MFKFLFSYYRVQIDTASLVLSRYPSLLRRWVLRERHQVLETLCHSNLGLPAALSAVVTKVKRRKVHFEFVIANQLARYWLIPSHPDIKSELDLQGMAGLGFRRQFGEDSAEWKIRISQEPLGEMLAVALPKLLLSQIDQFVSNNGLIVLSIRPEISDLWQAVNARLKEYTWLAFAGSEKIMICGFENSQLKLIRQVSHALLIENAQFEAWIRREAVLSQMNLPKQVLVYSQAKQDKAELELHRTIQLS